MAKEKQETESEIINETDTSTELTVEKQGKELIAQTNLSSSNLIKEFEREQLKKQLPEIYKPKEGVGFFGFIFLLIIIAFSIIGILKTFEIDLVNSFPEMESVYLILDEQLEYVSETVKNLTVIISDLFDKY